MEIGTNGNAHRYYDFWKLTPSYANIGVAIRFSPAIVTFLILFIALKWSIWLSIAISFLAMVLFEKIINIDKLSFIFINKYFSTFSPAPNKEARIKINTLEQEFISSNDDADNSSFQNKAKSIKGLRELGVDYFNYCTFNNMNIQSLNFKDCYFKNCNFSNCNMSSSVFHKSVFVNCAFDSCNIRNADFSNCEFWDRFDFKGSKMSNVNLNNLIVFLKKQSLNHYYNSSPKETIWFDINSKEYELGNNLNEKYKLETAPYKGNDSYKFTFRKKK